MIDPFDEVDLSLHIWVCPMYVLWGFAIDRNYYRELAKQAHLMSGSWDVKNVKIRR